MHKTKFSGDTEEESDNITVKRTLCSLSSDTFSDVVKKKNERVIDHRKSYLQAAKGLLRVASPNSTDENTTIVLKNSETKSNYFQKGIGKRVTQNLSKYTRNYVKKSTSRSKSRLTNFIIPVAQVCPSTRHYQSSERVSGKPNE